MFGSSEYIVIPLWWFQEQGKLDPKIISEASLNLGFYGIEIRPGLLVSPDLNGNIQVDADGKEASVMVQATPAKNLPIMDYTEVTYADLLHPIEIIYGDHMLRITEKDIYLDNDGLTF